MLNAIIVEDELHSREALKNLVLDYCPEVSVAGLATSIEEGVSAIDQLHPDLVFLDIALKAGTGFDLLEKVQFRRFDIIFTTAYEHFALRAIKFSAIDYLLKPIDLEELQTAVNKVLTKNNSSYGQRLEVLLKNLQDHDSQRHIITLSTQQGLVFIPIADIIRLEAMGSYTHFILRNGKKIMVSKHLKEYEQLLQGYSFFRIHQSHLINTCEVERFVKSDGGYVVLKDQTQLTVANNRKESFLIHMRGSRF